MLLSLFKHIHEYFLAQIMFCIFSIYMINNLLSFIFQGNYILNYLATRPKLVHYVLQALVQVKKKRFVFM